MDDLGIALASTSLGAALGYGAAIAQAQLDRRRVRRSFASFLLSELRAIEVSLKVMYAHPIGAMAPTAFESLRLVSEAIKVFRPNTVALLVEIEGYIGQIREVTDRFLKNETDDEAYTEGIVRAFASAAYNRIPLVKKALEREGGKYEPFIPLVVPPELRPGVRPSPLPPSAFPDALPMDEVR
jgi:hypothetical protein